MERTKEKGISLEQWAGREHRTWRPPRSVTDPSEPLRRGLWVGGAEQARAGYGPERQWHPEER